MRKLLLSLIAAGGLALAWAQAPSLPVLGQSFTPPAAQAPASAQLRALRRQLAGRGARVTVMTDRRGNRLHVYTNRSGRVFGVSWQGVAMPNLRTILGANFTAFQRAVARSYRRGPMQVEVNGLIVDLSGHMRGVRGRAYLAQAIPSGLSPEVVQ
jgi:hypothetical protein